jgi:hypothetical protein
MEHSSKAAQVLTPKELSNKEENVMQHMDQVLSWISQSFTFVTSHVTDAEKYFFQGTYYSDAFIKAMHDKGFLAAYSGQLAC